MTDCPHGMPTPASCIECMDDGNLPVAKREREVVERTFAARFTGDCPECHLPIMVGRSIVATSRGRYLHPWCIS